MAEKDSESQHLEVYLKIKSSEDMAELYKIKNNILECHVPTGSQALLNLQDGSKMKKEFSFSKIYGPQSTQTEIFNDCVKMKVLEFINGKNTTLFTYGTSGSGKTYTQSLTVDENPKVKPRRIHRSKKNSDVLILLDSFNRAPTFFVSLMSSHPSKSQKLIWLICTADFDLSLSTSLMVKMQCDRLE